MAGAGWCKGNINHSKLLCTQLGELLSDSAPEGDITFQCGDRTFKCHRALLATRCKYFNALLYGGMKESQPEAVIQIDDVDSGAFESLLKYLYTAHLSLSRLPTDQVLQLLELAHRYELSALEVDICSYLRTQVSPINAAHICQLATFYQLSQLQTHCLDLIDCHPSESLSNISKLSSHTLHAVLSRDSYPLPEIDIFRLVQKWLSEHPGVKDTDKECLLKVVRPCLISARDIFLTVIPTELFHNDVILKALEQQTLIENVNLPHRGHKAHNSTNLVTPHIATVVTGENGEVLFNLELEPSVDRPHCRHVIGDKEGITIQFNCPYIINSIKFLLPCNSETNRLYSYYVRISMDGVSWCTIVDYSAYHCHGWQHITLPSHRSVTQIQLVGTWCSTGSRTFCIEKLNISLDEAIQTTEIGSNGVMVPVCNVATIERGAIVVEGVSRHRSTLLNGNTEQYDWEDGYTCHQVGSGSIIVLLNQPYILSSLSLLLWDCDTRTYSYIASVSHDRKVWDDVINMSNERCSSWQHLTFEPRPVSYIRIIGTQNSANSVFHLVHLETPSQSRAQLTDVEGVEESEESCSKTSSESGSPSESTDSIQLEPT